MLAGQAGTPEARSAAETWPAPAEADSGRRSSRIVYADGAGTGPGAGSPGILGAAVSVAGGVGWLCAGPLVATLLIGRTAVFFPSARWLLAAAATWAATLLPAWAATRGRISPSRRRPLPAESLSDGPAGPAGSRSGISPGRQRPLPAGVGNALLALGEPLVLLGCVAPLLPLLYLDDESYHLVAGGAQAPARTLVALTAVLAVGGAAGVSLRTLLDAVPRPGTPPGAPAAGLEGARRPAALALLLGIAAMLAANQGMFGPLQAARGPAEWLATLWGLGAAGLAATLGAAAARAPWPAALGLWATWLLFIPWQEGLATRAGPSGLLLALSAAFWLLSRGSRWTAGAAGVVLGLVGAAAPAALWPVGALTLAGERRAAAAGLLAAAAGLGVRAWLGPPARLWEAAGQALAASPHLDNAAAGGFYARLFSGPGALVAAGAPPRVLPALALTAGTLATGALVAARAVHAAGAPATSSEQAALRSPRLLAALAFALASGLLLDGTTPRADLTLAAVALIPAACAPLWAALAPPARWTASALLVAGYALAATSTQELARAGAELLSRWPALATLPALGLVLLAAGLAVLAGRVR